MRVAVFGAGALGCYYGARLADGGADVSLIARGEHLAALRERGLTLVTPEGTSRHDLAATDDPAAIGPVDVVLFGVKSYDTEAAAATLHPLIGVGTAVVSLQNGIDNEAKIAATVGWDHVMAGSAYILAEITGPGEVTASGPRRIVFGEWAGGPPSPRARALLEACERGSIPAAIAPDVQAAKWEKFTLLVAFSGMTAATGLPLGAVRDAPAARALLRDLMAETWAVGRASGVALADDLVDRQFALLDGQVYLASTSMAHDRAIGHRMELEALQGTVRRLGREHGVATPATDAVYSIIEPWAMRNALAEVERPLLA
ncbi:MAG: 2-dehydropantoate 2-reductase [Candidatus Limnocylindrales bacterium]